MRTLFPYQEVGRDWLCRLANTGLPQRTGLHDEPGVGKTSQAIAGLDKLGLRRGIVVGPTAIRVNWPREFKATSIYERRIMRARHFNDFLFWLNGHADVLIISFEQAVSWGRYIHDRCETFEFLIIDEAHFLKNVDAKRTRQILGTDHAIGIEAWAEHGWLLTGTPFPNDPTDCYTQLKFVREPKLIGMSKSAFVRIYFEVDGQGAHSTRYRVKDKMLPELREMISRNFLRRTQIETGVELPPLTINPFLIEGDQSEILQLIRDYPGIDQKIIDAANHGSISVVGQDDHIATMRRLVGEAKSIPYAQMLLDELTTINPTSKVVVFGIHKVALANVRNYLWEHGGINAVTIDGSNTAYQREMLEQAYQNDPTVRVAFCNIKAGGTVLTLTAGHRIDMLETDWVPDNNFQAIKRVHRMTQEFGVLCRIITLADSFDEVVQEIVARKVANKATLEQRELNAA